MRALKPITRVGQSAEVTFDRMFNDRYNEDPAAMKQYLDAKSGESYGDSDEVSSLLQNFDSYEIQNATRCQCKRGEKYIVTLFNEEDREVGIILVVEFVRRTGNTWLIHNIAIPSRHEETGDLFWKYICGNVGAAAC